MNPAMGLIGRKGCGAIGVGVVDRLVYGGVRIGLCFGDDAGDLLEATELGLVITLDQGLLLVVGVALRLVEVETEDKDGDEGPLLYHAGSSCKLTMEIVCDRLY